MQGAREEEKEKNDKKVPAETFFSVKAALCTLFSGAVTKAPPEIVSLREGSADKKSFVLLFLMYRP